MLATQELRKRSRSHAQRSPVTAKRLAELLAATEGQEVLLTQRFKDRESHRERSPAGVVPIVTSVQGIGTAPPDSDEGEHQMSGGCPMSVVRRTYQEF
jgi:hypothetical protein